MKLLTLKCIIIGLCYFSLQCSTFHNQDVAPNDSIRAPESAKSLEVDSEWRINVTQASVAPKTQWDASCSITGDCWYWSSSQLFAASAEKPREISVRRQENESILNAAPVSKEMGWVVTSAGLFQVSNFGANWTSVAVPGFGPKQGRIHAVHFSDDKHGWVAGGVYRPWVEGDAAPNNALSDDRKQVLIGALAKTSDGGLNWETKRFDQSIGRFNRIVFSQRAGLVSGDAGIEFTSDAGETWKSILPDLNLTKTGDRPEVTAAFVLDQRHCWITVSGDLLRTEDGLRTWKRLSPPEELKDSSSFSELAFVDEHRGLAVHNELGVKGVYKTSDGGRTWTRVKIDGDLSGLTVVPGSTLIIAVGEGGLYSFTPI